jgi:U4/U6.U5 tri-snRNP-associated protein 3
MGFAKFNTTKGKHVPGSCNASAANIKVEKKYRQYMNRRGGFNRPLDPMK